MELQTKQACVFTNMQEGGPLYENRCACCRGRMAICILETCLVSGRDIAGSKLEQTLLESAGMGMLSRCLDGRVGYFWPRLALLFSQGGSRRMMSNPNSLSPGLYSARSQIVI